MKPISSMMRRMRSRVSPLTKGDWLITRETVFFDTLIDENAATHIAFGSGYDHPVEDPADKARINQSHVHVDFMIGGPELAVDGSTRDGDVVPVLRDGAWQI